ncbi:hypothetical protein [uncultured Rubinisphaera sp.]|uniref:hypothetical protein n=1 Tax=uncultured Rubinisphaera sp. TaxID=1678686 RepID=UPI0030DCC5CE|tara:strand:+ start:361 stop:1305 length:945 start_codon:yes stop_codon:yes gene_type:complete
MNYKQILRETRKSFSRRKGFLNRIKEEDKLPPNSGRDSFFHDLWRFDNFLLQKGKVIWASTIQANSDLYVIRDSSWLGEEVICSDDPYFDDHPEELMEISKMLFKLKGRDNVPSILKPICDHITDEYTRQSGLIVHPNVVRKISQGQSVKTYSIPIARKHLPDSILSVPLLPVLYHEDVKYVTMLPSTCWGAQLKEIWKLSQSTFNDLISENEIYERKRRNRPFLSATTPAIRKLEQLISENAESIGPSVVVVIHLENGSERLALAGTIDEQNYKTKVIDGIKICVPNNDLDQFWGTTMDYVTRNTSAGFVFTK